MSKSRVAVFVDGFYFYKVQRKVLNWWIDPKELLEEISHQYGNIVEAIYYLRSSPEKKRNNYVRALARIGYSVHTKEVNEQNLHTNFDLEICADIFEKKDHYDHIVLISGTNEFEGILRRISSLNKRFTVIGSNKMIGQQLLNYAGRQFVNFNDWKEQIIKDEVEISEETDAMQHN